MLEKQEIGTFTLFLQSLGEDDKKWHVKELCKTQSASMGVF